MNKSKTCCEWERAIKLYPETVVFRDTGISPEDSELRKFAHEMFPVLNLYISHLDYACTEVWFTLARTYYINSFGEIDG